MLSYTVSLLDAGKETISMNWPFRPRPSELLDHCKSIEPLLPLYADGMASPEETRRVEAHLPGCADCRAALSWMQATHRALASRPVALPPPDLHSRIALAIAASSAAPISLRPVRVFSLRPAYAAAASLTALGVALTYPLWHAPSPVAVVPAAKPTIVASVPHSRVKTHAAPKSVRRSLAASAVIKTPSVKHVPVPRKTAPVRTISPPEHIAANPVPETRPAAVPVTVKTPVHRLTPAKQLASVHIILAEKHVPVPAVKTVTPKPLIAPLVAKVIKEPVQVPVEIKTPTIYVQPPVVQTASAHAPATADDPLGSLKAQLRDNIAQTRSASLVATHYTVRESYRGATNMMHTLDSDEHFAYLDGIHSR